jgi:hypothetical protein
MYPLSDHECTIVPVRTLKNEEKKEKRIRMKSIRE